MVKRIIIILLTVTVMSVFGCKKMEESGITIEKAITVLEYAKTAKQLINGGNANDIADKLLKEINTDEKSEETEEETESDTEESE